MNQPNITYPHQIHKGTLTIRVFWDFAEGCLNITVSVFLHQFEARAVETDPRHLCWGPYSDISGKIVLAERGQCLFEDKVNTGLRIFLVLQLTLHKQLETYGLSHVCHDVNHANVCIKGTS